MSKARTATARKDGWWYPYIFVAGFAVVVTANLIMMFFATSSFTGLETKSAYERGNAYNAEIAAQAAQERLGWSVDLATESGLPAEPGAEGRATSFSLRMVDAQGAPLDGVTVIAEIIRPTTAGYDRQLRLLPVGPGTYRGDLHLPLVGQWDVQVHATRGEDAYKLRKRVVVR